MFVRAVVQEGIAEKAILVPQQGVSRNPKGEPIALVVDEAGKVQQRDARAQSRNRRPVARLFRHFGRRAGDSRGHAERAAGRDGEGRSFNDPKASPEAGNPKLPARRIELMEDRDAVEFFSGPPGLRLGNSYYHDAGRRAGDSQFADSPVSAYRPSLHSN